MHDLFDICDDDMDTGAPHMPLIGDPAPAFVAQTTNGTVNFPADYIGKWVIFFSHPADFTPVCTSEFMAFQAMLPEFQELNADILGLSVGTLSGHLAWLNAIKDIEWRGWKNMEITFPLIDDMNMEIANKYGMIQPNASDTKAVRAVFIIDPKATIRAILYYPLTTGRNFDEIKRMLIALQTTDAFAVSTPADWRPGDDILVPAPATTTEMEKRIAAPDKALDVKTWFFAFKKLAADTIYEKIRHGRAATPQHKKKK